jgi:hypothetical protein
MNGGTMHQRRKVWTFAAAVSLGLLGLLAGYSLRVFAEGAPTMQPLFYSGTLEVDGRPASGPFTGVLSLHDAASGGTELCSTEQAVAVDAGRFRMDVSPCVAAVRANPDVWLSVQFTDPDGVTRSIERSKVGAMPYALEAQHAVSASTAEGALRTMVDELNARLATLEQERTVKSAFAAIKSSSFAQSIAPNQPAGEVVRGYDELFDAGDEFNPGSAVGDGKFVSKSGGHYEFTCTVAWDIETEIIGHWEAQLWSNADGTNREIAYSGQTGDGAAATRSATTRLLLAAGDEVSCRALVRITGGTTAQPLNNRHTQFNGRRFVP